MSSSTTNRSVRLIGLITIMAGVLMILAGGATWAMVTSQLKAEHITVAAVTPRNPGRFAGKPVAGPLTAYAQASAINTHALKGAGGRTYAELGAAETALQAGLAADGLSKKEVAKNPEVLALAATRATTMNGSFLRASLFTSIVSFGVAALVMALGVLFTMLGFALRRISTAPVVASVPVPVAAPAEVKA